MTSHFSMAAADGAASASGRGFRYGWRGEAASLDAAHMCGLRVSAVHATRHARSPRFARGASPRARAAIRGWTSEAEPGTRRKPFVAIRARWRA